MNYDEQTQLRYQVIDKLAEHGVWVARSATMEQLAQHVRKVSGKARARGQILSDYLGRWVGNEHIRINPPYRPGFRPLDPAKFRHPRLADIQRAQPPMVTPTGTGNWNQYSQYMLDNGRSR